MRQAISLSDKSIDTGGGPFGAVVVKDGEIIASASNQVTLLNDPTAHAEVTAIREACKKLDSFDLSGCEIYTSCEPCPMCLSAMYWARIDRFYFANNKTDAQKIGFDDSFIYSELKKTASERSLPGEQILREEAQPVFEKWDKKEDKTKY